MLKHGLLVLEVILQNIVVLVALCNRLTRLVVEELMNLISVVLVLTTAS